ncbi:hypothetical protein [Actinomadura flavalba]|uniref:hypothetical protein n=1 Tax=Actinomadura flavalba TaxID=1120938 RepID=UPI00039E7F48|nr:hypothetical protein [Actinomadura flavalba]
MPILAGVPTPPPPPVPSRRPRRPPKRIIWTSTTGDVLDLTGGMGYEIMPGRSGFGLGPRENVHDPDPDGGAQLRAIVDQVRLMAVPLAVRGSTPEEYLERRARLHAAMRHRRGGVDVPGTLTVELPDGTRRHILAFYNDGLDGEEDVLDDVILTYQQYPRFELLAMKPWFTGDETVAQSWTSDAGVPWLGALPLRLSPAAVLGEVTVVVPGDADAYPVWTITGPGAPIARNLTTGREWVWKPAEPIASGRTVTIDTRPSELTVVDDLGNDLYTQLEPYPDLWELEPGVNNLQIEITDSTAGSSAGLHAQVRWQAGW